MKHRPELVDDDDTDQALPGSEEWTVEVEGSPYRFPVLAKLGLATASLCAASIIMIFVMPMMLPSSMTINYAEKIVSQIVGFDIKIHGSHDFSILPSLHLKAEGITQADPDAHVDFSLKQLDVEMSALGALSGSVDVERISLIEPQYTITQTVTEKVPSDTVPDIDQAWGWWRDMSLKVVSIKDAGVIVIGEGGRRLLTLRQFNLQNEELAASDPEAGIKLYGQGLLNDQKIDIQVMTSDPQLFVSGNRWPVKVSLLSENLDASFEGSIALRERMVGDGKLKASSRDAVALNAWIGPFLPARDNLPVTIEAGISMAGDTIDVSKLNVVFAATSFVGNLKIVSAKPMGFQVTGKVDAAVIDLGSQMGEMPDPIPDTPLPFHMIPAGKLDISWQRALWHDMETGLGHAVIEHPLKTDRISVTLNDTSVYGGVLRGDMTLDKSEGLQALHIEAKAVGVAAGPFLSAGRETTKPVMNGKSTLQIGLFSVGGSMRQLMEALTGTAELLATDGVLDMPRLTAEIAPTLKDGLNFKSLNGNFRITQGIASSEDLLLRTDDLSLVGKGQIDLTNGTLDIDIGRLNSEGGNRTLKRYRVSGPTTDIQVEAVNAN